MDLPGPRPDRVGAQPCDDHPVPARPPSRGALVAAVTAVLAHGFPYKLGLLAAVLAGMVTAMVVEGFIERRKAANV